LKFLSIGIDNNDTVRVYLFAIYWCLQTLATVGFGDVHSTNDGITYFSLNKKKKRVKMFFFLIIVCYDYSLLIFFSWSSFRFVMDGHWSRCVFICNWSALKDVHRLRIKVLIFFLMLLSFCVWMMGWWKWIWFYSSFPLRSAKLTNSTHIMDEFCEQAGLS